MWEEIFNLAVNNGIWAVLFLALLVYQLKDSKARETKYQQTISSLNESIKVVEKIDVDLNKIDEDLNKIDKDVESVKVGITAIASNVIKINKKIHSINGEKAVIAKEKKQSIKKESA